MSAVPGRRPAPLAPVVPVVSRLPGARLQYHEPGIEIAFEHLVDLEGEFRFGTRLHQGPDERVICLEEPLARQRRLQTTQGPGFWKANDRCQDH